MFTGSAYQFTKYLLLNFHRISVPGDATSPSTQGMSAIGTTPQAVQQPWQQQRLTLRGSGQSHRDGPAIIDKVPGDVLLEIFDHCQDSNPIWEWHLLAHVCPRWRQIIFKSPHRLNLQILCTYGTPVRKGLSIWPPFPIVIDYRYSECGIAPNEEDNVIAALEHPDRVCYLGLDVTGPQLQIMATVMQDPFPVLTDLSILSEDRNVPVLPEKFLGRLAPSLQTIFLHAIPFPALPTLLLSTGDLVDLRLHKIPPTGYISPAAIVVGLAALPRLESIIIEFQSASPPPIQIRLPPETRTSLPCLTSFRFKGASEYLEDLVARIEGPRIKGIFVDYFNQLVDFQVAHLSHFIDRSLVVGPEITRSRPRRAHITFFNDKVSFTTYNHTNHPGWDQCAAVATILCKEIDWQVSHVAQVLGYFSATLSYLVHLKLEVQLKKLRHLEDTENVEWLHLLNRFSTVRTLRVSRELAGHVAHVLEDTVTKEMVVEIEALRSLDFIWLERQPASSIARFVASRRFSDHPVTVIHTETEFYKILQSYTDK